MTPPPLLEAIVGGKMNKREGLNMIIIDTHLNYYRLDAPRASLAEAKKEVVG